MPPPAIPPPGSEGATPPPGAPPYGAPYYPYPYYPPQPKRDNLPLVIILVVVVLVIVITVILAAVLYVMTSNLLVPPTQHPMVTFGPVSRTAGNATLPIFSSSAKLAPSTLEFAVQANATTSSLTSLPPPDGSVVVYAGNYAIRVFWLDNNHDGMVGTNDGFWVTGNIGLLPPSTSCTFYLQSTDGRLIALTGWTT